MILDLDEEAAFEEGLRQPGEARGGEAQSTTERAARYRAVDEHLARQRPWLSVNIVPLVSIVASTRSSKGFLAFKYRLDVISFAVEISRDQRRGASGVAGAGDPAEDKPTTLHLHRGGTSVVLDLAAPYGPAIVHWGEALSAPPRTHSHRSHGARPQRVSGGLDATGRLSLLATAADGWLGTPGIEGHRDGAGASVRFEVAGVQADDHRATISLVDAEAQLAAQVELRVGSSGLLHQRILLRNTGETPYTVQSLQVAFPVPWDATELLDTTGRHLRERTPQRRTSPLAPICARAAAAGRAPTRRCFWRPADRASASSTAGCTASMSRGAAITASRPSA